jgi:23S rRNA (guanosine2251-2'-O)-methyltransferase
MKHSPKTRFQPKHRQRPAAGAPTGNPGKRDDTRRPQEKRGNDDRYPPAKRGDARQPQAKRGDDTRYPQPKHRDDARRPQPNRGDDRKPYAKRGDDDRRPQPNRGDAAMRPVKKFNPRYAKPTPPPARDGVTVHTPAPARENFGSRPAPRNQVKTTGVMLYGLHAVRAAWLNPQRICHTLWLSEQSQNDFAATLQEARTKKIQRPSPKIVPRHELEAMLSGSVHQGIALDAAGLPAMDLSDLLATNPRVILLLDQVTDPHNVGAVLRSAAAFGAGGVVITERHAPGVSGTLAKAASGALDVVPLVPVVNLARALEELREAGYWCVGLAEEGTRAIGELDLTGKTALVLGAEGEGLRRLTRERCDELARLPTQPPIGSLNVSNAAAVSLYEIRRQQKS